MAYEHKDNSGSLFKNDRKERDTQPDYKGSAKIDGVEYWMSAWVKDGGGGKFFSIAMTPKHEQARPDESHAAPQDVLDDSLPV